MRYKTLFAPAFCLIFFSSCGALTSKIAGDAAPAAVQSGIEAASSPENRERIQKIAAETPVKAVLVGVDGSAVDSVISRLAAEQNEKHLRRLSRLVTSAMAEEMTKAAPEVKQKREEILRDTVSTTVHAAVDELRRSLPGLIKDVATNPDVQNAVKPLSRSAAGGAVTGAVESATGN